MTTAGLDALIVTALQLERRAVCMHLADVEVEDYSGVAASIGTLARDDGEISIGVLETGAGNVSASVIAVRAEEVFRPAVVLTVGVAGGLKDVQVGDVVASSKIYFHEGGKQLLELASRPDFAPVSPLLLQSARGVAANDSWRERVIDPGPKLRRPPDAWVEPVTVGDKVLADERSVVVEQIRNHYGDAVCVDMEDYGALRGVSLMERTQTLAVRAISDLLDDKAESDAQGSQPLAVAHAAAFAVELLEFHVRPRFATARAGVREMTAPPPLRSLYEVGRRLYPQGPDQDGLWERAGGDASRLHSAGTGQSRWWGAVRLLERGGVPDPSVLIDEMLLDYPRNADLKTLRRVQP